MARTVDGMQIRGAVIGVVTTLVVIAGGVTASAAPVQQSVVDSAYVASMRSHNLGTVLQGSDAALISSAHSFCEGGGDTSPIDDVSQQQIRDMFGLSKSDLRVLLRTMALYYCPANLGN